MHRLLRNIDALFIAVYLLLFYSVILFLSSLGFLINNNFIVDESFISSLFISVFAGFYLFKFHTKDSFSIKNYVLNTGAFIFLLLLFILISVFVWDNSYDGQTYHLQGIHELANGWNPIKQVLPDSVPNAIYINNYAKAFEIFGASVYKFTNNIESAKVSNLILFTVGWLLAMAYFKTLLNNARRSYIFATLVLLNPVISTQLFSFMPDGQMASGIIILIFSFLLFLKSGKFSLLIWCLCLMDLMAFKFTGLVYAAIFTFFGSVFLLLNYRSNIKLFLRLAVTSLFAFIVGILIVSNNPYCTNLKSGRHIFYPLMGKNAVNIMVGFNSPQSFEKKNRIEKFFIANAAFSGNVHGAKETPEPRLKLPFYFQLKEWTVFKSVSVLYGGFGPLFSGILLLTVFLLLFLIFKNNLLYKKQFLFLIGALVFSVFINPECWLARYVPQLWLLPICVVVFFSIQQNMARVHRFICKAIIGLMCVNALGIFSISVLSNLIITSEMKHEYNWLKKTNAPVSLISNDFISTEYRLNKYDVPFKKLEKDVIINSDSAYTFKPITSSSVILLPKNVEPYKAGPLFNFLESFIKNDRSK